MKEFDLEKAKQGHPVCTRDGRDVEILKFDLKASLGERLLGLIKEYAYEFSKAWFKDGRFGGEWGHPYDLFLKSEQKEGWVNVFDSPIGAVARPIIYKTKEEALSEPATDQEDYIDTVPIKWEE